MSKTIKSILIVLLVIIAFISGWSAHIVLNKGIAFTRQIKDGDKFLAADENGNYIGEVIGEYRDWKTKTPTGYKIRQRDGSIIERDINRTKIYAP